MSKVDDPPLLTPDTTGFDAEAVWRAHGLAALRFATVLIGPDDAHDVTVNAFVRVAAAAGRAEIRDVRAYLLRAVANESRSQQRQTRRRLRRDLAAVGPTSVAAGETDIDVRRAIRALTVRQRAIVYLVYWEDLTEAAAAELLGISTGTTHRLLATARDRMRRMLR